MVLDEFESIDEDIDSLFGINESQILVDLRHRQIVARVVCGDGGVALLHLVEHFVVDARLKQRTLLDQLIRGAIPVSSIRRVQIDSEKELRDAYDSIREFAASLDPDSVNYVLDRLIRRTVTDRFYEVNRALDKIIAGDLTQTVNVRSNPEFLALSDGINTMVGGLKKNLTDSRRRVKHENELAKSIQQTLIPPPGRRFVKFEQIDFVSSFMLASHKGSDVFETFVTDAGRPGFVMVEAIGDSVSASLSMMKFRAISVRAFRPPPVRSTC